MPFCVYVAYNVYAFVLLTTIMSYGIIVLTIKMEGFIMDTLELRKEILAIRSKMWRLEDELPDDLKEYEVLEDMAKITSLLTDLNIKLKNVIWSWDLPNKIDADLKKGRYTNEYRK